MEASAPTSATSNRAKSPTVYRKPLAARLFPYFLVAPTLVFVFLFTLLPTVQSVSGSLYRAPLTVKQQPAFVGLQNYVDLFDATNSTRPDISDAFPKILINTIVFTLATVLVSVPLAFVCALLLNRKLKWLGLWRFSLFYPALLPVIGAASIWSFLYSDNIGLINTVLKSFGLAGVKWIGLPGMTLVSVIIVICWKQVGYYMIFYLAGLQSIPRDIYEAADLEGANLWQQIRYITFPLLNRTTLFILVVAVTGGFQTVEQLQALGQGGPNESSNLMLYYIFQKFSEPRNLGYVNAITVILLIMLMVFTVANFYFFEWRRIKDDQ
ncbi:MAG: ABC transporter permease subunit [Anaerolineaceae bacterium]|nr:ABC transporter permease subunit [Anaerolineaceae bacterium]